jgi:hypothetical protein
MDTTTHIRRCNNFSCRVDTFKATNLIPFNCCPVCLVTGIQLPINIGPLKKESDKQ